MTDKPKTGSVAIVAEHWEGELQRISLELLGAGRRLADKLNVELVAVLIDDELQEPGLHSVKFDASGLRYGKYIAELIIRNDFISVMYKEEMTKSALWHEDDETSVTD